ncbi:MAG: hypothetical protein CMJ36_03315 [Phycisphaerae bacterium]|nr:hypothetical protein [Phycisphaerae bacterium]
MFIPIGTDRPVRRRPRVVEVLIVLNMLIYLLGLASDVLGVGSFEALTRWMQLSRTDFNVFSLVTYQFAHSPSDILHLVFNMVGLWIFGVALNDRLGHMSFLAFYLMGGAVAGGAHMMDTAAPVIGASGSVCALIGGFIALFPRSRIRLLILFFIIGIFEVGSLWVVGFYVFIDFIGWVAPSDSSVAYIAHLAGYLYGFLLALVLLATRVIKSDDFDMLYILRQKKRRAEWKRVVTSAEAPSGAIPARELPVEHRDESAGLRARLRKHIRDQDWTGAAEAWRDYVDELPEGSLPEEEQLELANRLLAAGHRAEAATAYERVLANYPGSSQMQEVELMLGMLYARNLQRPDDAKPLLEKALKQLQDVQQRALAQTLLDELQGTGTEPTP